MVLSAVLMLAGCGGKGSAAADNREDKPESGRYDFIITEEAPALSLLPGESILGGQYLGAERLWLLENSAGQLFCYYEGKGERELLLERVPAAFTGCRLYMDGENFYAYQTDRLTVLDAEGKEAYTLHLEGRIISICMSREGSVVLAVENGSGGAALKTLDTKNGALTGGCTLSDCVGIGTGTEREVLVIDRMGVYEIDMESGEKSWHMEWNGTSYLPDGGFWFAARLKEDGSLEQIKGDGDEFYEVGLKKIYPEKMGKVPIVFRVLYADAGLKKLAAKFNRENGEYHVFLQDRGEERGWDFQARNDMEIATGKGPDLIAENAVSDMRALAQKGALENLEAYLEQAGIRREDYHRETFQSQGMEQGVYSAGYEMRIGSIYIREAFLSGGGQTDIKTLLDNMEGYDGQAVFNKMQNYTPVNLLHYFFWMSDDFYGMVDWEAKTCDFSKELWRQALQAAREYGLTEGKSEWEEIAGFGYIYNFSDLVWLEREAGLKNMALAGYPSESGMVHWLWLDSVAINADSAHKEGAWQFIRFLLEEENQKLAQQGSYMPVHMGELQACVSEYLEAYHADTVTDGGYIIRQKLPDGIEEKFWECLENAKPEPYRTGQVLAIIEEEAAFYFTGDKTMEEVSAVIENRVRLYLAELE